MKIAFCCCSLITIFGVAKMVHLDCSGKLTHVLDVNGWGIERSKTQVGTLKVLLNST